MYRWVSRYTKAHMPRAHTCTKWEVHAALFDNLSGRLRQKFIVEEYGIQRMTLTRLEKTLLKKISKATVKEVRKSFKA